MNPNVRRYGMKPDQLTDVGGKVIKETVPASLGWKDERTFKVVDATF